MPFEQAVRVALDDRAVHERAGVALVGVADQVLLVGRLLPGELPLLAGREAAAAAAAQAARSTMSQTSAGVMLAQRLGQGARSRRGRCTRRCWPGRSMPQLASTQRVCGAKNGCSSRNGTPGHGVDAGAGGTGRAGAIGNGVPANTASSSAGHLLLGRRAGSSGAAGRAAARRRAAPRRTGRCSRPRPRRRRRACAVEPARGSAASVLRRAGAEAARAGADEDDRARQRLAPQRARCGAARASAQASLVVAERAVGQARRPDRGHGPLGRVPARRRSSVAKSGVGVT